MIQWQIVPVGEDQFRFMKVGRLVGASASQHDWHSKVNTVLCQAVTNDSTCQHEAALGCDFAHSVEAIEPFVRNEQYKTEACKNAGQCGYGVHCAYAHPITDKTGHLYTCDDASNLIPLSEQKHKPAVWVNGKLPFSKNKHLAWDFAKQLHTYIFTRSMAEAFYLSIQPRQGKHSSRKSQQPHQDLRIEEATASPAASVSSLGSPTSSSTSSRSMSPAGENSRASTPVSAQAHPLQSPREVEYNYWVLQSDATGQIYRFKISAAEQHELHSFSSHIDAIHTRICESTFTRVPCTKNTRYETMPDVQHACTDTDTISALRGQWLPSSYKQNDCCNAGSCEHSAMQCHGAHPLQDQQGHYYVRATNNYLYTLHAAQLNWTYRPASKSYVLERAKNPDLIWADFSYLLHQKHTQSQIKGLHYPGTSNQQLAKTVNDKAGTCAPQTSQWQGPSRASSPFSYFSYELISQPRLRA